MIKSVLIAVALGTLFGFVGALVGHILGGIFKSKKLITVLSVLGIAGGLVASRVAIDHLEKSNPNYSESQTPKQRAVVDDIVRSVKQKSLFSALFRIHPKAETEFRLSLAEILENTPSDEVAQKIATNSQRIVAKYFDKHVLTAPDEALYKLFQHTLEIMLEIKNEPQLCVDYFVGEPKIAQKSAVKDWIARESEIKTYVLEASIENPSFPPSPVDEKKLFATLVAGYNKANADLSTIMIIEDVYAHDSEAACNAGIEMYRALLALSKAEAAYVLKGMIVLGNE